MGFQRHIQLWALLVVILDFCSMVEANLENYPNCTSDSISSIGDGFCDQLTNNNKACGYDEGDCCECTCILNPNRDYSCEVFECLDPNSGCADPSLSQYTNCTGYVSMIGNSWCNSENNNEACAWDEGDCCECTCIPESSSDCDTGNFACLDPDSGCADSSLLDYIDCGGDLSSFGDGACNSENNNEACGWDGGDCCECTCVVGSHYDCGSSEFFCKDINSGCIDPLVDEYGTCGGDLSSYGDGYCDSINNNQACGWDGGDCCECTCNGDTCLDVNDDSDCSDPNAARGSYGCMDWPTEYQPCMSESQQTWVVKTTQQANSLAEALNCSGGVFEVEWHGNVAVDQTFRVVEGTILNMTGYGSSAIMDGGCANGLFIVMNAFLYVANMTLVNGSSTSGGAIAALDSRVYLHYTKFVGNVATHNGGALFVAEGSTIAGSKEVEFANNRATRYGGAACARGQSLMTWTDGILYVNNSAGNGGAVDVSYGSIALWTGVGGSTFSSNIANFLGGALYVDSESSTTWEGGSIFEDNYAGLSGGGAYVSSSKVSWRGSSKFIENTAGSGGGLFLSNVSATWTENISIFSRNSADYGGALYGTSYSNISWAGETIFSSNIGQVDGGAVIVADVTTATWSAATTFFNNTAFSDGGGVYLVDGGIASWMENATFAKNSAGNDGGVLRVCPSSTTLSGGRTTFSGNTAGRDGGALYLEGTAAWEGEITLAENVAANQGGAVCVKEGGIISWSANTLFFNNSAHTGGALVATSGFHVSWTAETNFTSNRARQDGGALALTFSSSNKSSSLSSDESSTIVIAGKSSFVYNTCGWSGGALSLSGLLSISANASLVFVGNAADIYGGALYISSMDIGPVFHGARFDSNHAQVGGGVYAAASGTMVTVDTVNNDPNEHPTTFDSCTFINNEAFATGGAVSSASGQDIFTNTKFIGNVARGGGALQLAGTASIINCVFEGNIADAGGGSVVSNIGYISEANNSTFLDNIISCDGGFFLDENEGQVEDLWEVVCDGCDQVCENCDFGQPVLVPECVSLSDAGIEHASSSGGITTIEELEIDQGYWRATSTSTHVLECYNSDACRGGVTGSVGYCSGGYGGPYCSVCSANFTITLNSSCTPCSALKWSIVIITVIGGVGLVVGVAVVLYLTSADLGGSAGGLANRVTRRFPLHSIKIVIVAWQIVTQFASVANVSFPFIYQRFLDAVDAFNFELSWVLSTGCVFSFDFHDRLLIATIGPLAGVALLGVTYAVATARHRRSEADLRTLRHKHMFMVLLITFLVYSSASSMVFQMFACEILDDGKNYLRADYRIECDSAKHKALQIYSAFMIILYPVGTPLMYAGLLFKHRHVLKKAVDREGSLEVKSISYLWKPYKPSRFYYEIIECIRRMLLTGAVVFIYPNTAAQVAVTLVMAFAFTMLSEGLAPYDEGWDKWISRTGHVIVFMSMYIALILKVEVSDERASSQRLLAGVLVVAHICMVLAVIAEAVVMSCSVRITTSDEPRQRVTTRMPFRVGKNGHKTRGVLEFDGIEACFGEDEIRTNYRG